MPVVPTAFVHPGEPFAAPEEPFVVKPAISAGGRRSARFDAGGDAARELVAEITGAGETAMVQPLLSGVRRELARLPRRRLLALSEPPGGASRGPRREVLYLEEELGPYEATAAERQVAEAALACSFPHRRCMRRVDLLGGLVLELELVEPSLYLAYCEGAADRLAAAVAPERLEATAFSA